MYTLVCRVKWHPTSYDVASPDTLEHVVNDVASTGTLRGG